MQRFLHKVCLVTGAGSGIGKATALAFGREGAKVAVADLNLEQAEQTCQELKALQVEALAIAVNIAVRDEVEAMVKATVDHFGRLDCAVNCAGIAGPVSLPLHEYPDEYWHQQINVNLTGTWYCMKFELIQMLAQGGGNIVNLRCPLGVSGFLGGSIFFLHHLRNQRHHRDTLEGGADFFLFCKKTNT